jgi:hypothetical protein
VRQQALAEEIEQRIRELAGQQRVGADGEVEVRSAPEPAGILVRVAPAEELRWTDPEGQALAHFLSTSLLRNVFIENLHRRVRALEPGRGPFPLAEALRGVRILRGYFRLRNPGFLAYRFGEAKATAVTKGLARLQGFLEERSRRPESPGPGPEAENDPAARRVSLDLL